MSRGLRRWLLAFGIAFALITTFAMCGRVEQRGRYATPYSSISAADDGARGLYLLISELGRTPERWTRDFGALPRGGMMVALGGCDAPGRRRLSPYEDETLLSWIEGGGVLLVAGQSGYLAEEAGVALRRPLGHCATFFEELLGRPLSGPGREGDDEEGEESQPAKEGGRNPSGQGEGDEDAPNEVREYDSFGAPVFGPVGELEDDDEEDARPRRGSVGVGELFGGVGVIPLVEPARVLVDDDARVETLLRIGEQPAGVLWRHGRGAVIAIGSASPFTNAELDVSGAVLISRILARAAPEGKVFFDEYHLGIGATRSILAYLRGLGAGPLLLQVAFVLALVFYRRGARFGEPRLAPPAPPTGTATYVEAVGALYERSGDRREVARILSRRALWSIAERHRIARRDAEGILAALRGRVSDAALDAVRALDRLGTEPFGGGDRELLRICKEIDGLYARATEEGKAQT